MSLAHPWHSLPELSPTNSKVAQDGYPHLVLDVDMPHHRPDKVMQHPTRADYALISMGDGLWREVAWKSLRWLGNPLADSLTGTVLWKVKVTQFEMETLHSIQEKNLHLSGPDTTMGLTFGSAGYNMLVDYLSHDKVEAGKLKMALVLD